MSDGGPRVTPYVPYPGVRRGTYATPLVRYWWVAVKLVMNVLLSVLILVALRPGMADVGAAGVAIEAGQIPVTDISSLVFPPTVSLTMLTVATVLSVYKPGGRVRRRSRKPTAIDATATSVRRPVGNYARELQVSAQQRLP